MILTLCFSCIEPYEPKLEESQELVVISGMITDQPGLQTVSISRSAPYRYPEFQPLEQCIVTVCDQEGNMIYYSDEGDGVYVAEVPDNYLEAGDAVSLHVITSDMKEYRSSYDTILSCPGLDSIYWEQGVLETADPERSLPGIQFYLDMSGDPSDARNIIWRVDETWEYWAALFGTHRWWGDWTEKFRSNVIFKCWKNFPLDQFYTGTTRYLASNKMERVALNFVSNETDRLKISYSLHVQQQSLSGSAYSYWKRMFDQSVESGGLYDKQPASVVGNIYSVNNPDEVVLGYFYGAQVREKRIFVHNDKLFDFNIPHIQCEYEPISVIWSWEHIDYPVYIYSPGPFQPSFTGPQECFDCRLQGGDTIRPEYWESW